MRTLLIAFAALVLLTPRAEAASWTVDHTQSKLGFVAQWSGEPYSATFQKWDATIEFDPADLANAKAVVTIDLASLTSSDSSDDDDVTGSSGFDVSRYPQARFETKSFRSTGPNAYEAVADLTIRGTTKEITLPFTLVISGNSAHMTAEVTLMRTDFNVGRSSEDPVAHAVKVTVDLMATKPS